MKILRLGTRGSALAQWQAQHVIKLLQEKTTDLHVEMVIMTTKGDQTLDKPLPEIGGKGAFTEALEDAIKNRQLDCAVHSLKDLPTTQPAHLVIGAVPQRGSAHDVLISRQGYTLETLPKGARVGTGSPRRAAQLRYLRPDLQIGHIRGNIDTRINKAWAEENQWDAIVLAHAGLERLERLDVITQILPLDVMLPAPGQAALAVQCRDEETLFAQLRCVNHLETEIAVTAERAFLSGLGGGCALPIAAYGIVENQQLLLRGRLCSSDGQKRIDVKAATHEISLESAKKLGHSLAQQALSQGGSELMKAHDS